MVSVIYSFAESPLELSEQWHTASIWSISHQHQLKGLFGDIYTDTVHIQRDLWNAVSMACAQKAVFVIATMPKFTTSSRKAIKIIDMLSAAGASLAELGRQPQYESVLEDETVVSSDKAE